MGVKRVYEVGYWIEERERTIGLKFDQKKAVGEFLNIMVEGSVEEWKRQNQPTLDPTLWNYEIEEARPIFLETIKKLYGYIYWEVVNFVNQKRLYTLLRKDYANIEDIRAQPIDWIKERDGDGATKDISIDNTIVRPPSLFGNFSGTPEQLLQDKEFYSQIMKLLAVIRTSGRRYSSTFSEILELELLDGVHVTSVYGSVLKIPNKDVASFRFRAFKFAQQIALEFFPELTQMIENLKRGTKCKAEKLKVPRDERVPLHGPIKLWRRGKGERIIPYEKAVKIQERLKRWRKKGLLKARKSKASPFNQTDKVGTPSLSQSGDRGEDVGTLLPPMNNDQILSINDPEG